MCNIDFLGYIPSFRKTFKTPWSETMSTWMLAALSNIFAIVALQEYNALTLTYIITITLANLFMFLICLLRRPYVEK